MSIDLGFIKAIHSGSTPPINTQMLWYDTGANLHKYYDVGASAWVALASGAASWTTVLTSGAESLGVSPIISPGDQMKFQNGGFEATLEAGVLSGNQTLFLPDQSGTIALLSDIAGAGDLNAALVAGNITGGVDILLTTGDAIRAVAGDAFLDLRNTADGFALLHGANESRLFSPVLSAVESTALATIGTTAGPSNGANTVGFGINTLAADALLHILTGTASPSAGSADVLKIDGTAMFTHIGHDTGHGYIQSYSGWFAINPDGADAVGVATGTTNPAITADIFLGIGDSSVAGDKAVAVYASGSNAAEFRTYSNTTEIMSFGHNSSNDGQIVNNILGGDIQMRVNVTGGTPIVVATARADQGAFEISGELTVGPPKFSPAAPHPGGILSTAITDRIVYAPLTYTTSGTFTGAAGFYEGRILIIMNRHSTNTITLQHNNVFGAGFAQFSCPGGVNLVLGSRQSATLIYDANAFAGGNGAWVVIATG